MSFVWNSSLLNSSSKFSSSGLSLKAQLCHLDQSQKIMSCARKMKKPFLEPLHQVINQKTLSLALCFFFFFSETKPNSLPFHYLLYCPITGVYRWEGLVLVDSIHLLAIFSLTLIQCENNKTLSPQTRKSCSWKGVENSIDLWKPHRQNRNVKCYRINHGNQNEAAFWRVEKKTCLVSKLACRCEPPAPGECRDLQPVDISRQTGSQWIVFKCAFWDWLTLP